MDDLITLTIHSTHFYLIDCAGGKLLIDAGWALPEFIAQMKAQRLHMSAIRYVMFTHHHPDHAGLVQDIRDYSGAKLIIHEKQIPYLDDLRAFYHKKGYPYTPIRVEKADLVSPSRETLRSIGVPGEIFETPGHSDDSISLLLDNGAAFIGDLTLPDFVTPETAQTVHQSWRALLDHGAKAFYHSHAPALSAEEAEKRMKT